MAGYVFDCSSDDAAVLQYLPCISDCGWTQMAWQLLASLIVWLVLVAVVTAVGNVWRKRETPEWVHLHFGSPGVKPVNQTLNAKLRMGQLICSTTVTILWIYKSYAQEKTAATMAVETICCLVFLTHLVYALINSGFDTAYALSFEGWLDAFTITPLLMQLGGGSYLTLAYLRTYRMNTSFVRLCATGVLEPYVAELAVVMIKKLIEFIMVITYIAGTSFICEGLGDVPHFADRFVDSSMGGISFFQTSYWSFTVMSTVGFGDYSPTTVFSRFFIFGATIYGVVFFSNAAGEIVTIADEVNSGKGTYRPKKSSPDDRGHVLVLGGGVSANDKSSIECFLKMLCRDATTPPVVIMGDVISESVKAMCAEPWASSGNGVHFFTGSALKRADLDRVKTGAASMVFIAPDIFSASPQSEDHSNVLTAIALQNFFPTVQFRLMAVEVDHLKLANNVGLNMFNCYAIDGLKSAIMATSLRCPGFAALVLNLGLPPIPAPKAFDDQLSPWLMDYIEATNLSIYGFRPALKYREKTFKECAMAMGEAGITLLAIQVQGLVILNPGASELIDPLSICFAIAPTEKALNSHSIDSTAAVGTWLPTFASNRAKGGGLQLRSKEAKALKAAQDKEKPVAAKINNIYALPTFTTITAGKAEKPSPDSTPALSPSLLLEYAEDSADKKLRPPKALLEEGGFAVILLLYEGGSDPGPLYAQVEAIVGDMRNSDTTPVVICGPSGGDSVDQLLIDLRAKFSGVYFVEGDVHSPATLERAGLRTAAQLLTLAPAAKSSGGDDDRDNLLTMGILDNQLREWSRGDLTGVVDWVSPESFPLMVDPPSPWQQGPLPDLTPADRAFGNKELRCHYRYAAGRVLPKPFLAGCYSAAYYTPGVLEVIEAIVVPAKTGQSAVVWPYPVPEKFQNKSYYDAAQQLLVDGAIPMGVLRASGPLGYSCVMSPSNEAMTLQEGDAIYVLAPKDWAEDHLEGHATAGQDL